MFQSYLKLPRNIYLLSISQVIGMAATTIVTLLGGIIGAEIAPSTTLATLPTTTMILGVALTTIPAALLMKRIGRKKGFLLFAIIASCSSLLAAYAVIRGNFFLFCISTFFIGTNGAFVQQYRFAATESVSKTMASKAVGFLLFAGILAGVLGPEIAKHTRLFFSLQEYAGPFIVIALLFAFSALLLSFLKDMTAPNEEIHVKERDIRSIVVQPRFYVAVLAASSGFGVMTFVMTATPIHLHNISHYSLDHTVFIIQSHIVAMFLPSLFTGILIQKFGIFRMLLAGLASFFITVLVAINAHSVLLYWIALVLLGVGWNFLYISSTVLLSQSHSHLERFKAQGLNDFIVMTTQMLASLFAGIVVFSSGWVNLNMLTLPIILFSLIIFILNRKYIKI